MSKNRARQTSGTGPCGDCRRVLWVPGPRDQYSGKFVLSRNVGYKTRGVAMTPASLPISQTSGMGPSASCGYCCPLCPTGGRYPEKFRFYRGPGGKWSQEQRYATGEPGKFQSRDRVGIVERSYGYRARGVSIRGKFVLSRNMEYKTR